MRSRRWFGGVAFLLWLSLAGGQLLAPAEARAALPGTAPAPLVPAGVLDLQNWKLTLPTGPATDADQVTQPALATFAAVPWFAVVGKTVALRAPVDGSRTSTNTGYARSELREMAGIKLAAWDAATGTHQLLVTLAFAHLPLVRPTVVGAQIHDGIDDITTLRLEGTHLWVTNGDNAHYALLTAGYVLGTRVDLRYVVRGGVVEVWLNGVNRAQIPVTSGTLFFKTGAYLQANCDNSAPCDATNYGEVRISSLKVAHT